MPCNTSQPIPSIRDEIFDIKRFMYLSMEVSQSAIVYNKLDLKVPRYNVWNLWIGVWFDLTMKWRAKSNEENGEVKNFAILQFWLQNIWEIYRNHFSFNNVNIQRKTNKKPIGTCCHRRYQQTRTEWIGKASIAMCTKSIEIWAEWISDFRGEIIWLMMKSNYNQVTVVCITMWFFALLLNVLNKEIAINHLGEL